MQNVLHLISLEISTNAATLYSEENVNRQHETSIAVLFKLPAMYKMLNIMNISIYIFSSNSGLK